MVAPVAKIATGMVLKPVTEVAGELASNMKQTIKTEFQEVFTADAAQSMK